MKLVGALLTTVLLLCWAGAAKAHPLAPLGLEVRELAQGHVLVKLTTARKLSARSRFAPRLPSDCKPLAPPSVERDNVRVVATQQLACNSSLEGRIIGIEGMVGSARTAVVQVSLRSGISHQGLLTTDRDSWRVPLAPSRWQVARSYLGLGSRHMLSGVDHLLFVLGLCLLARRRKRIVLALTAFTFGHSLTLCAAALRWVAVDQAVVEVAIAASLMLLALQVVHPPEQPQSERPGRPLWLTSAAFGLLHGLGFAAGLADVGLPDGALPLALFSFNMGVELAQLAVALGAMVAAVWLGARLPDTARWRKLAPGYVLGGLASMWCIERAVALMS